MQESVRNSCWAFPKLVVSSLLVCDFFAGALFCAVLGSSCTCVCAHLHLCALSASDLVRTTTFGSFRFGQQKKNIIFSFLVASRNILSFKIKNFRGQFSADVPPSIGIRNAPTFRKTEAFRPRPDSEKHSEDMGFRGPKVRF